MKITRRDRKDMLIWGSGALATGLAYSLASTWIRQKTNSQDLSPATEALFTDAELFSLCCQLQEYRQVHPDVFSSIIDNADRLVLRYTQLRDKIIEPHLRDRAEARAFHDTCLRKLEFFLQAAKQQQDVRLAVEIHNLYVKIFEIIERYLLNTIRLTEDIQPRFKPVPAG